MDSCVKEGDCITVLLEAPGPILLKGSVIDYCESDELRTAVTSPKLLHPISKVEISVGLFRDQDLGACKSSIWLTLRGPENDVVAEKNLYGTYRSEDYPHGHKPPDLTFSPEDEVVSLARPGCAYELRYIVGGGGGHEISVRNWRCRICYTSEGEPSQTISFPDRSESSESEYSEYSSYVSDDY